MGAEVSRLMGRWSRSAFWLLGVFVWLGVFAEGCGRGVKLPPLAEVSGTVTLDGKALAGATVQFIPDETKGTKGLPAQGVTDENGHFELTTLRHKGAPIGFHKVMVEARRPRKGPMDTQSPSLIPLAYNDPKKSGLSFEVKKLNKGEKNEFNLPLTSAR